MPFFKRLFASEPQSATTDEPKAVSRVVRIHRAWLDTIAVHLEERNPPSIEFTKLIRNLEDVQRGGSEWRLKPSMMGYGRELEASRWRAG